MKLAGPSTSSPSTSRSNSSHWPTASAFTRPFVITRLVSDAYLGTVEALVQPKLEEGGLPY